MKNGSSSQLGLEPVHRGQHNHKLFKGITALLHSQMKFTCGKHLVRSVLHLGFKSCVLRMCSTRLADRFSSNPFLEQNFIQCRLLRSDGGFAYHCCSSAPCFLCRLEKFFIFQNTMLCTVSHYSQIEFYPSMLRVLS